MGVVPDSRSRAKEMLTPSGEEGERQCVMVRPFSAKCDRAKMENKIFDTGREGLAGGGCTVIVLDHARFDDLRVGPMIDLEFFSGGEDEERPERSFDGEVSLLLTKEEAIAFANMILGAVKEAEALPVIRERDLRELSKASEEEDGLDADDEDDEEDEESEEEEDEESEERFE